MRLRYGVIGAGVVAPLHLQAIAALDDVELVGISADDQELAVARAQEAGCPSFVDHRELLALAPDVVVVCTPHPSHPPLTIAALEAGAHVLVEKPLAVEAREADTMIDAADRAGRLLGVCFQQRFRPVIVAAHALVASGRLGELLRISIVDPLYRPNSYYAHRRLARNVGGRGRRRADEPGAAHARSALSPRRTAGDGVGPVAAALAADGGRRHGDRARRVPERRRRYGRGLDPRAGRATHRARRRPRPDRDRGRVAHLRAVRTAAVGAPAGCCRDVRASRRS